MLPAIGLGVRYTTAWGRCSQARDCACNCCAMDQPKAEEAVAEVFVALDQAMEQVRKVSQSLAPSPAYRIGIQGALEKLIGERQAEFPGMIRLKYSATATT